MVPKAITVLNSIAVFLKLIIHNLICLKAKIFQ